ncbi:cardiolipin synthase [Herbaspirillum sp. RV1423]|uniref:cardiolipin synthase n=1 Tax=Herbaspirillum sp. RV1423 TaxID=1443993 RepID=UPI0004B58418|nr:cardiolipin synthase [Herbaspirillum sp. RV1423]
MKPTTDKHMIDRAISRLACPLLLAASLALAGCGSLPRIVPDMGIQPAKTIQIKGGRGILSAEQSQAVLDKFKNAKQENLILEKHLAVEEAITGSPLVAGNKVTLLIDGPATYASMFSAIREARDHINMETYIFENDDTGKQFADLLIDKQKHGVQVNLMYDSVGTLNTPREFFQPLIDAGVQVLEFNPVNPALARKGWEVNQRDHRKLLIVDGTTAFVGGINISSVYSSGSFRKFRKKDDEGKDMAPWRDTQVRMDGPVAAEFQKMFIDTWEKQHGPQLAARNYYPKIASKGGEIVRGIGSSPEDPYSVIYATFISAIQHAESLVYLTNAYFIPDPQLRAALKDAVKRGVDVRLMLPGKSDSALVLYASHSFYTELLEGGVRIYERQDALLHSKTALIDGVWSTIGSTNLDWRSFVYNQEINAVILGPQFGAQLQALFDRDLAASKEITLEAWKDRPISDRMKEFGAGLWARWL